MSHIPKGTEGPKEEGSDFKVVKEKRCLCVVLYLYQVCNLENGSEAFFFLGLGTNEFIIRKRDGTGAQRGVGLWEKASIPPMWDRNKNSMMKARPKEYFWAI